MPQETQNTKSLCHSLWRSNQAVCRFLMHRRIVGDISSRNSDCQYRYCSQVRLSILVTTTQNNYVPRCNWRVQNIVNGPRCTLGGIITRASSLSTTAPKSASGLGSRIVAWLARGDESIWYHIRTLKAQPL
jgi:hypothetical protein